jgi:hypothetical protein
MMQTSCKDVEGLSGYQYGLSCIDGEENEVRHMFGADSFDPVETFDTKIECAMCLGLGSSATAVADGVATLKEEVAVLKEEMKEVKAKIDPPAEEASEESSEASSEDAGEASSEDAGEEASTEAADEEASLLHRAPPKVHEAPGRATVDAPPKVHVAPRVHKEKAEYHAFLKKGNHVAAKVRHHKEHR